MFRPRPPVSPMFFKPIPFESQEGHKGPESALRHASPRPAKKFHIGLGHVVWDAHRRHSPELEKRPVPPDVLLSLSRRTTTAPSVSWNRPRPNGFNTGVVEKVFTCIVPRSGKILEPLVHSGTSYPTLLPPCFKLTYYRSRSKLD